MKQYTNVMTVGDTVLFRGIDTDGMRIQHKDTSFQPDLFVTTSKPSKYKNIYGESVGKVNPGSIRDCRDFIEKYQGIGNMTVYGNERYVYQYIHQKFPGEMDWGYEGIRVAYIDLECTCEDGFPSIENPTEQLLVITVCIDNQYHVFGLGEYSGKYSTEKNVKYYQNDNEESLIYSFLHFWQEAAPDIITGWNVNLFDIPFLINRIKVVLGLDAAKRMSPWNMIRERNVKVMNRDCVSYDIVGIAILDYYDLYKKFTYKQQESYKLGNIANVELGEEKLSYEEYDNIKDFYKSDWNRFLDYNVKDVELIVSLEDKMKILELVITLAYEAKVNFDDVFSQVRTWDSLIYNHLIQKDVVIPLSSRSAPKNDAFVGAYVKEPKLGMSRWIMSFDAASLYPSLIQFLNISPDVYAGKRDDINFSMIDDLIAQKVDTSFAKESGVCVAANGTCYRRDRQGFLSELMEKFYIERSKFKSMMIQAQKDIVVVDAEIAIGAGANLSELEAKKKKLQTDVVRYRNNQAVRKVALNSAYGSVGNAYFRFYSLDLAEAITTSGQLVIRWVENALNVYLNKCLKTEGADYVIASDTDSVYVCFDEVVKQLYKGEQETQKIVDFLDELNQEVIQNFINKKMDILSEYLNGFPGKIVMKRESICSNALWIAKKRYVLNLWDEEGVRHQEPKIKAMGIEVQRSSTPKLVRKELTTALRYVMDDDQDALKAHVKKIQDVFDVVDLEEIASPRGCNGIIKYASDVSIYSLGSPIAVRGSLLYNHFLKAKNLDKKYSLILDGEKVKFIYLMTPNPINENVISFMSRLPNEFGLQQYIDRDMQFQKTFMDPLRLILASVGWNVEDKASIAHFF